MSKGKWVRNQSSYGYMVNDSVYANIRLSSTKGYGWLTHVKHVPGAGYMFSIGGFPTLKRAKAAAIAELRRIRII